MANTTTKKHQDEQIQKALKKRDANLNKNKREHRKFLKDAMDKTYDVVINQK